jgi:catechol 2,3-dioxygenase-like lactoylglutathione lyase family enzyme
VSVSSVRSFELASTDPDRLVAFYEGIGLRHEGNGELATEERGVQLRVVEAAAPELVSLTLGVDDASELAAVVLRAHELGFRSEDAPDGSTITDDALGVGLRLTVAPAYEWVARPAPPAHPDNARSEAAYDLQPRGPRLLGHLGMATTDLAATVDLFVDAFGFSVSDRVGDSAVFLHCDPLHHSINLLAAPVPYLHHSSWEMSSFDELGHWATSLLGEWTEAHVWGPGRHNVGSNFFWYVRDPDGNIAELSFDLDEITDEAAWTPRTAALDEPVVAWGLRPPRGFFRPPSHRVAPSEVSRT